MGAGEDPQGRGRDAMRDTAQVDRRHDRIAGARRCQGGHGDARQLAVVGVAAQPGVLGGDLGAHGGDGDVEIVGDRAVVACSFEPAQEAAPLGLPSGRVELAQNRALRRVGLAVDRLRRGRAQHGAVPTRVGAGQHEVAHPCGVFERQSLGDEAAHRPAENRRPRQCDRLH